jgi:hypothetical protein
VLFRGLTRRFGKAKRLLVMVIPFNTHSSLLVRADFQTSKGDEDVFRVPLQETSVPNRTPSRTTREHHTINAVSNSPRESLRKAIVKVLSKSSVYLIFFFYENLKCH